MRSACDILADQWRISADRLDKRLDGIADPEFFWTPVTDMWTVHPWADGSATIDYDVPAPEPAPVTTIAWRLVHIANGNWIYWEHAFGPAERNFTDLVLPTSAEAARHYWHDSRAAITDWIEAADDADLTQPRPSHLGRPRSASEVMTTLIDEQTHHGAEIGLLRDLYLRRE
ncbi:MAG TPA: DinB family protein [Micromonosporaceae bacterium]|nr:DinB family protein [Micromonosporaceae bacterium]